MKNKPVVVCECGACMQPHRTDVSSGSYYSHKEFTNFLRLWIHCPACGNLIFVSNVGDDLNEIFVNEFSE